MLRWRVMGQSRPQMYGIAHVKAYFEDLTFPRETQQTNLQDLNISVPYCSFCKTWGKGSTALSTMKEYYSQIELHLHVNSYRVKNYVHS
mmetsp:Transcript_28371/g.40549  ORF Transcript_28371/g.40549 Transcript_28371/m.40549 type:complete len:89 (-) Transcript_28371:858-1124(-)